MARFSAPIVAVATLLLARLPTSIRFLPIFAALVLRYCQFRIGAGGYLVKLFIIKQTRIYHFLPAKLQRATSTPIVVPSYAITTLTLTAYAHSLTRPERKLNQQCSYLLNCIHTVSFVSNCFICRDVHAHYDRIAFSQLAVSLIREFHQPNCYKFRFVVQCDGAQWLVLFFLEFLRVPSTIHKFVLQGNSTFQCRSSGVGRAAAQLHTRTSLQSAARVECREVRTLRFVVEENATNAPTRDSHHRGHVHASSDVDIRA